MEMDKIQEQWPEWQTVELVGEGTFGSVYKAKKEVYGNISYAAIKVIEIPNCLLYTSDAADD